MSKTRLHHSVRAILRGTSWGRGIAVSLNTLAGALLVALSTRAAAAGVPVVRVDVEPGAGGYSESPTAAAIGQSPGLDASTAGGNRGAAGRPTRG